MPQVDRFDVTKLNYIDLMVEQMNKMGIIAHPAIFEEENDGEFLGTFVNGDGTHLRLYHSVMRRLFSGRYAFIDLSEEGDGVSSFSIDDRWTEYAIRSHVMSEFFNFQFFGLHTDQITADNRGNAWDGWVYRIFNLNRPGAQVADTMLGIMYAQFSENNTSSIAQYYNDDFRRRVSNNTVLWFSENGSVERGINEHPIREMMDRVYNRLWFEKIQAQGIYAGYFPNNPNNRPGDITLDDFSIYSDEIGRIGGVRKVMSRINLEQAQRNDTIVSNARGTSNGGALVLEEACDKVIAYFPGGTHDASIQLSSGAAQSQRQQHRYQVFIYDIQTKQNRLEPVTETGGSLSLPSFNDSWNQMLFVAERTNGSGCQ